MGFFRSITFLAAYGTSTFIEAAKKGYQQGLDQADAKIQGEKLQVMLDKAKAEQQSK